MPPHFTDECRILEAAAAYRCGLLTPGKVAVWAWENVLALQPFAVLTAAEADRVTLRYVLDGQPVVQVVGLEFMPCKPTRGVRPYWRCAMCGGRCWKLFNADDCRFGCRHCLGLEYRCLREQKWQRLVRYAEQRGVPWRGAPVNGKVPMSYRHRGHDGNFGIRRSTLRNRVYAAVLSAVLAPDD